MKYYLLLKGFSDNFFASYNKKLNFKGDGFDKFEVMKAVWKYLKFRMGCVCYLIFGPLCMKYHSGKILSVPPLVPQTQISLKAARASA